MKNEYCQVIIKFIKVFGVLNYEAQTMKLNVMYNFETQM